MDELENSGSCEVKTGDRNVDAATPDEQVKGSAYRMTSDEKGKSQTGRMTSDEDVKSQTDKSGAEAGKKKKVRKKKSAKRYAAEFFIKIGVTALLIWALCTFVIGIYIVHSNSGYPMLKDGDLCIIYRLGELHQGDEIAYIQDGKLRFGRIVAMPGNSVDLSDGNLTVNGYGVFEDAVYPTTGEGAVISFPYEVPEDSYFVLNDYRSDVTDSRSYGAIMKKNIKGKVVFVMRRRGI